MLRKITNFIFGKTDRYNQSAVYSTANSGLLECEWSRSSPICACSPCKPKARIILGHHPTCVFSSMN